MPEACAERLLVIDSYAYDTSDNIKRNGQLPSSESISMRDFTKIFVLSSDDEDIRLLSTLKLPSLFANAIIARGESNVVVTIHNAGSNKLRLTAWDYRGPTAIRSVNIEQFKIAGWSMQPASYYNNLVQFSGIDEYLLVGYDPSTKWSKRGGRFSSVTTVHCSSTGMLARITIPESVFEGVHACCGENVSDEVIISSVDSISALNSAQQFSLFSREQVGRSRVLFGNSMLLGSIMQDSGDTVGFLRRKQPHLSLYSKSDFINGELKTVKEYELDQLNKNKCFVSDWQLSLSGLSALIVLDCYRGRKNELMYRQVYHHDLRLRTTREGPKMHADDLISARLSKDGTRFWVLNKTTPQLINYRIRDFQMLQTFDFVSKHPTALRLQ